MKNVKLRSVVTAVSGVFLLSFGASAMADSNSVLVQALINKGILTEEEGALLTQGHADELKASDAQAKKNKSKIVLSDYIDSITPTGDIRTRYETREAKGIASSGQKGKDYLGRGRYAWHLGVKTSSDNDFFTELRFASNTSGRSPNVDFAQTGGAGGAGVGNKNGGALVDRAYIGWNATDWMTLIAGRQENQLYTTSLVWDRDVTPEGLTEKFKTKMGGVDLFATLGQYYIQAKYEDAVNGNTTTRKYTTKMFPVQIGAHYQINDESSIKVAPTLYTYAGANRQLGVFNPGTGTGGITGGYGVAGSTGVNNLRVLEIPAEYNWMMADLSWRVFGDYAHNFSADNRADAAGAALAGKGNQDNALMLGLQFGSKQSLKSWESQATYWGDTKGMKKHDWSGRVWYQRIEAFALDQNIIDSDIMNAQVNLQGFAASGIYMLSDNAFATLTAAHAHRIDDSIGTGYSADTSSINTKTYNLLQADISWKF